MTRLTRIIKVTAGLAVAGAVVGAISGMVIMAVLNVTGRGIGSLFDFETLRLMELAAGGGAVTALVAGPLLSWGILRRVPLGNAILATAIGTVSGGVIGELLWPFNPYTSDIPGLVRGAFVGFVLAGVVVRLISRKRVASSAERDGER